jgi:hypothetical protein
MFRWQAAKNKNFQYFGDLGLFGGCLLCAVGTAMVLAGNMRIPTFNTAELKTQSHSIAGRNGALVPLGSPGDCFLTNTTFFPDINRRSGGLRLHYIILQLISAKSNHL